MILFSIGVFLFILLYIYIKPTELERPLLMPELERV